MPSGEPRQVLGVANLLALVAAACCRPELDISQAQHWVPSTRAERLSATRVRRVWLQRARDRMFAVDRESESHKHDCPTFGADGVSVRNRIRLCRTLEHAQLFPGLAGPSTAGFTVQRFRRRARYLTFLRALQMRMFSCSTDSPVTVDELERAKQATALQERLWSAQARFLHSLLLL